MSTTKRPAKEIHLYSELWLLLLPLLLLLGACQADRLQAPEPTEQPLQVTIQPEVPRFQPAELRASTQEEGIQTLRLLVFRGKDGEAHTFLYSSECIKNNDGTYTAELIPSSEPRIIHFVANYSFPADFDQASLDLDEGELIPSLTGDALYLWGREAYASGIPATGTLQLKPQMLRSQAKLTIQNETPHTIQFKYIHAAEQGTVAPFDPRSATFAEGTMTLPNGLTYSGDSEYKPITEALYTNERPNEGDTPLYLLLKVQRQGQSGEEYYKLDLLKNDYERYALQRNHHYQVTLKGIQRAGYPTEAEAIQNMPANSSVIDHTLEVFPAIFSTDGKAILSVEQTTYSVGAQQPNFNTSFRYRLEGTERNDLVEVEWHPKGGTSDLIKSIDLYQTSGRQNGTMSVHLNPLPQGESQRRAYLIITANKGTQHELKRTITVTQFAPFSFTPVAINGADPASLQNETQSGIPATLTFTIPDEYPKHLYPIPIQIVTNTLNPDNNLPVSVLPGGQIAYTYMATKPGKQSIPFRTTRKGTQEVVTLKAPNFQEYVTGYNIGRFSGTLTYSYGTTIQQANLPEGRTSHLEASQSITGEFQGDGTYRYRLSIPIQILEGGGNETIEVGVRIIMVGGTATTGETTSYRKFTIQAPIAPFREEYQKWKADRNHQVASIPLDLKHTSTYIFGSISATDYPGQARSIPEGTEIEVWLNAGQPTAKQARGKVWRDNTFEIEYPVSGDVRDSSPVSVKFITRQPTLHGGVVVETYSTQGQQLGSIARSQKLTPTRSALTIYGEMRGETGAAITPYLGRNLSYRILNRNTPSTPFSIETNGRYKVELPADLQETERIEFARKSGLITYKATTTLQELRKDSKLVL